MKVIQDCKERKTQNGKTVAIKLRNGIGKMGTVTASHVYLVAVDEETEKEILMLMAIYPSKGKSRTYSETKWRLENKGYDTSFTQWTERGAMFVDPNGRYN